MTRSDRQRVVVTGMGLVTPVGNDLRSSWDAVAAGRSGAGPITLFEAEGFRVRIACEVKGFAAERYLNVKQRREMDRFTQFAVASAAMAVEDAGLELTEAEQDLAGCIIGVGMGGLHAFEEARDTVRDRGSSRVSPYTIVRIIGNIAAGHVSMAHGLKGPSFAPASACATGAHSIGEAAEMIRGGRAEVMLAGGAEAAITPVGIGGFQAMRALSKRNEVPGRASRPFDRDRDGFVCGEGGGVLVLESLQRAKARSARIYGELTGYGCSSDAFHLTAPEPSGEGCGRAMRMALRNAALDPSAIGYLNAHATSTPVGDRAETAGILRAFGERARGGLPVSSTKSMTGHLLGAAGAVEAGFALCALAEGVLPPTVNVDQQDEECPLDVVPNQARAVRGLQHVMSNAFGFGGTNASLVFSRV